MTSVLSSDLLHRALLLMQLRSHFPGAPTTASQDLFGAAIKVATRHQELLKQQERLEQDIVEALSPEIVHEIDTQVVNDMIKAGMAHREVGFKPSGLLRRIAEDLRLVKKRPKPA